MSLLGINWGGALTGAVGGFLTGGPAGAIAGGVVGGIRPPGSPVQPMPVNLPQLPSGSTPFNIPQIYAGGGSISIGGQNGINLGGSLQLGGSGGPGATPTTTAAVAAQGACPRGYHLNKHALSASRRHAALPARSICVRNRSMNPLNPRALRRALRREKSARHLISKLHVFHHAPARRAAPRRKR